MLRQAACRQDNALLHVIHNCTAVSATSEHSNELVKLMRCLDTHLTLAGAKSCSDNARAMLSDESRCLHLFAKLCCGTCQARHDQSSLLQRQCCKNVTSFTSAQSQLVSA